MNTIKLYLDHLYCILISNLYLYSVSDYYMPGGEGVVLNRSSDTLLMVGTQSQNCEIDPYT